MSTGATYIGHGSKFGLESSTPGVYTDIDGVVEVTFGSNKVDVTDTTDMGTPGITRVFQPGLENPGDCTLKMNHKPGNSSQEDLKAAKDGTVHNFKVTYPAAAGGGTDSFSGIIVGIDRTLPDDKPATLTVKIQITGPVKYTAGS